MIWLRRNVPISSCCPHSTLAATTISLASSCVVAEDCPEPAFQSIQASPEALTTCALVQRIQTLLVKLRFVGRGTQYARTHLQGCRLDHHYISLLRSDVQPAVETDLPGRHRQVDIGQQLR